MSYSSSTDDACACPSFTTRRATGSTSYCLCSPTTAALPLCKPSTVSQGCPVSGPASCLKLPDEVAAATSMPGEGRTHIGMVLGIWLDK